MFEQYDAQVPQGMKIKLTSLPGDEDKPIIGFVRGLEYENHVIYKEIVKEKTASSSTYVSWIRAESNTSSEDISRKAMKTAKLQRLLETAMVPSAINPLGPKSQRSTNKNRRGGISIQGNHFPFNFVFILPDGLCFSCR